MTREYRENRLRSREEDTGGKQTTMNELLFAVNNTYVPLIRCAKSSMTLWFYEVRVQMTMDVRSCGPCRLRKEQLRGLFFRVPIQGNC